MIKEYGYEYDAMLDTKLWKKTKNKVTYDRLTEALCVCSGRDALKAIAREYEATTVFIPALSCDSMTHPFEMYGHRVTYYRLHNDYTIDLNYLKKCMQDNGHTCLFLYMDYFGINAIDDATLKKMKEDHPQLVFIEDRTHNLIWKRTSKFQPDYVMASLRKWISVPDGGLLWTKHGLKNDAFSENTTFASKRLKVQCMRHEFFNTGNQNIKLEYRKIFSTVSDILDEDKVPTRMSAYSYEIAQRTDWNSIRSQRKSNAEKLIDKLKKAEIRFVQNTAGLSDLYVAFMIKDREAKQRELSSEGVFNTIIWPLSDEQKEICEVAKFTEEHMLAAPCDQRYSINDMDFIGNEIVRVCR